VTRIKAWNITPLEDAYGAESDVLGVVRYDGDPDVFTAVVHAWLITEGIECVVAPPKPRLYRWNPDPTGEFTGLLYPAQQPGSGVWLGATVVEARTATGPVASRRCGPCNARVGQRHYTWCVFARRET
jgi:hypothetical protein